MKRKKIASLSQRNLLIMLVTLIAVSLLAFSLLKGEPKITGAAVKTEEAKDVESEKLEITVGELEKATYTDYDFDEKDWLDKEYFRVWVKVFNPNYETKVFDSIRLVDNLGNQYDPYATIASRISEQVFGNYMDISARTIREGYLTFPKLETRNVRLVFEVDGKTNAFQLR